MKKFVTALLALTMVLSLAACGEKEPAPSAMSVRPAVLTPAEEALLDLLDTEEPVIFDFTSGTAAKSLHIRTYHLQDGAWQPDTAGDSYAFESSSGRLALTFDQLPAGLQVALQTPEGGTSSAGFEATEDASDSNFQDMAFVTARLSGETELRYDEEIPLVVQGMTSGSSVYTLDVSEFDHPESYPELGYASVYAVTMTVSESPLTPPETAEGEEAPPAEE